LHLRGERGDGVVQVALARCRKHPRRERGDGVVQVALARYRKHPRRWRAERVVGWVVREGAGARGGLASRGSWPVAGRACSLDVVRVLAIVACVLAGCSDGGDDELRQGGDTTVDDRTREAFSHPAANLTAEQRATFQGGSSTFGFVWPIPVLGPLFNHDACLACHAGNGRGLSQIGNGELRSQALIRVSLEAGAPEVPGGDVPVPGLGLQLQDHATEGLPEVIVTQSWIERTEIYGDGEVVVLRAPRIEIRRPDGTPLAADIRRSYRQAPGVFGLGLLEAVPDEALLALADPDDDDGDGISGRVNQVWDGGRRATAIGRFGHKASVATLLEQTAAAFANDIGLTNPMFPASDGMRDITAEQLAETTLFVSAIAVPAAAPRNAAAQRGRGLFDSFGCGSCHVATLVTGDHPVPQLAHQTIHPYSDLLLHDMGDLLSDERPDFAAAGVEWRTPPLWGIGVAQVVARDATFLHDGRARTLAEAILWHGGEALAAREAFRLAPRQQRDDLIGFLQTL
jgi:CxxC motif-containing protein (DUF1111 family)